jgi:hypothetical protein
MQFIILFLLREVQVLLQFVGFIGEKSLLFSLLVLRLSLFLC